MWEFFIKNNKFAYLFLVALVAVGSYSLISIPKESAPEVIIPIGIVSTVFPGAPAADIEALITNEIERGLTSLENVKQITSTSREGVSSVIVEFEANADLDESIQSLKDEIDAIKQDLPADATDPFVSELNFVDQPILTIALAADLSDIAFADLGKQVEREIELISGVSRVQLQGVRDRQVTILLDQTALAQYSLSLSEVTAGLRNANQTLPVGQIINDGIAFNVAFEGDIPNAGELPNIAVATRDGQPVYIRDIAIVEDGLAPASSLSRLSMGGEPSRNSISFDVFKQAGGDITQLTAAVNDRVIELTASGEILDGIQTSVVLDSGELIRSDLIQLSISGLQTVILVVLLLVAAIGWREGLLAGLAIPLSFLFGFIGLYFSGNTINFLSLFALILGIGILVDSAIVMVEGINRKMKDNPDIDKKVAAIETIYEFAAPLTAGTLTTISMFTGLFIVTGVIGQFIESIPFTLIFLLLASLFVSLFIIPLLATTFLKRRNNSRLERVQVEQARRLVTWYTGIIRPILASDEKQFRFLSAIFAILVFSLLLTANLIAGLVAAPLVYVMLLKTYRWQKKYNWRNWVRTLVWVPLTVLIVGLSFFGTSQVFPTINPVAVEFFEQSDVDFVIVEIENPEGTTKETTDITARRVEEILYNVDYIESFSVTVGSGSQFGGGGSGEKFANVFVSLRDDRTLDSTAVVEDLRSQLAPLRDLKISVNQPSNGPPTGAAIIVKFLGDDLAELTELANSAAQLFRSVPNTVNVETSTNSNSTEFVLELDRAKAASLGLSPFQVSQVARTAVFGTEATTLTTLNEDITVVVKLNVTNDDDITVENANVISIDALEQILIPTQSGTVPLSSLVSVTLRESSSIINHEAGKRVVTVTADVGTGGNAREIQVEALHQINEQLDIPEGVELSTGGGESDDSNQAFLEILLALIVGVILMIGVLTLQFNSYLHTRYVLSILPYSLIGIFAGLALTMNPLSFPSIMGFIALSGIVVNNSILLIDMMNQMRKKDPTRNITDVVLDAAGNRLRPILLTTMTTVIGMVPLTYAGDLWAPLAYAVMFGLVFSVVITLVLIPILYNRNPGTVER